MKDGMWQSFLWLCFKAVVLWVIVGFVAVYLVFGVNFDDSPILFTVEMSRQMSVRATDLISLPIALVAFVLTLFWYIRFDKKYFRD